jgi:hypothetical protein
MSVILPTTRNLRTPVRHPQKHPDAAFGLWAAIILTGLAIVAIWSGVTPTVDPTAFPLPQ